MTLETIIPCIASELGKAPLIYKIYSTFNSSLRFIFVNLRKMLNLYCPSGVTHLKCCGKVFDLSELKDHVDKNHEAGRPNRTEPSISPA